MVAIRSNHKQTFFIMLQSAFFKTVSPFLNLLLLSTCRMTTTMAFLNAPTFFHQHHRLSSTLQQHRQDINEFSRIIQPERVVRRRTNGSYTISVTANPEEREALAQRFQLSHIGNLTAELTIQADWQQGVGDGVIVQGICGATVTQRCVRTNEEFSANLEFPVDCIVRPVASVFEQAESTPEPDEVAEEHRKSKRKAKQPTSINEIDLLQLQNMLQTDMDEDDLMEDEMIYSTDGRLDVGELVAQLFWLTLDPYPKKPGSTPVQRSISG